MRDKYRLAAFLLGASMLGVDDSYKHNSDKKKQITREMLKDKAERLKKSRLNKYEFNGNVIYARNKKNAIRKAKNKGFI